MILCVNERVGTKLPECGEDERSQCENAQHEDPEQLEDVSDGHELKILIMRLLPTQGVNYELSFSFRL